MSDITRRTFVKISGGAVVAASLAGCTGGDGPNDDSSGGSDENGNSNGNGDDSTFIDDEPDYESWFDDVGNYEGTVDMTGEDQVTVMNGTGPNGQQYDPPAIAIDVGTTVVWEWTGDGGAHDVAAEGGTFQSEMVSEEGHTYDYTFEEEGVYKYACTPHKTVGMKGAVYVR